MNIFTKGCQVHYARDYHHLPLVNQIYYTLKGKTSFIDTVVVYTDLPKKLELPDAGCGNPFHCFFEMIARFYYYDSGDNDIIYYFPKKSYLIETLLNYLPTRFKRETEKSEGYEYLDFPGLQEKNGVYMHNWPFQYIRNLYKPLWENTQQEKQKIIYISRAYPKNTDRAILNEEEVIASLRQEGISTYILENMTVEDSITLFCSARVILASHGAGLAWSVFCHPGTILIEIYDDLSTKQHYSNLAAHLHLEFYRFIDVKKENNNYKIDLVNLGNVISTIKQKISV